jgi:hypothetical protein
LHLSASTLLKPLLLKLDAKFRVNLVLVSSDSEFLQWPELALEIFLSQELGTAWLVPNFGASTALGDDSRFPFILSQREISKGVPNQAWFSVDWVFWHHCQPRALEG